jgi:ribosomal protein S12 methylthiotransferase
VKSYYLASLGCPKNLVDSEAIAARLEDEGLSRARSVAAADLIVVNTCAFIEEARRESVETILYLSEHKRRDARLVVTGCLAERYRDELAKELEGEAEVAGIGEDFLCSPSPVKLKGRLPRMDLARLPRSISTKGYAYLKIAEGCSRACRFCAIPQFRGPQASKRFEEVVEEARSLVASQGVHELILVAQDVLSWGRDLYGAPRIEELYEKLSEEFGLVRCLYLYPGSLSLAFARQIARSPMPYFDLSFQHVSQRVLRCMGRSGDAKRFERLIEEIRSVNPNAAIRGNFIVGHPGEREEDHLELLSFLEDCRLDWAGFFLFSPEEGTPAASMPDQVPREVAELRLRELSEVQDRITLARREELVGQTVEVVVHGPGRGHTYREVPDADGEVMVPGARAGELIKALVVDCEGPDLVAEVLGRAGDRSKRTRPLARG